MEFDGVDDGLIIAPNPALEPDSMTIIATVEFRSLAPGVVYAIASKSSTSTGQVWNCYAYQPYSPGPHMLTWNVRLLDAWGEMHFLIQGPRLETGVRYRIGCIFHTIRPAVECEDDGQHYKAIYMNGALAAEDTQLGGRMAYRSLPIYLGRYGDSMIPMDGWIYDFRMFDRVLTPDEFRQDALLALRG